MNGGLGGNFECWDTFNGKPFSAESKYTFEKCCMDNVTIELDHFVGDNQPGCTSTSSGISEFKRLADIHWTDYDKVEEKIP